MFLKHQNLNHVCKIMMQYKEGNHSAWWSKKMYPFYNRYHFISN